MRLFQLYWSTSNELVESLVSRAEACGCEAIVVTLDTTLLGWRTRDLDLAYLPFLRGKGIAQYTSDPVFTRAARRATASDEHPSPARAWARCKTLVQLVRAYPERFDRALLSGRARAAVQTFIRIYSRPSLTWEDLPFLRERTKLPDRAEGHPPSRRRPACDRRGHGRGVGLQPRRPAGGRRHLDDRRPAGHRGGGRRPRPDRDGQRGAHWRGCVQGPGVRRHRRGYRATSLLRPRHRRRAGCPRGARELPGRLRPDHGPRWMPFRRRDRRPKRWRPSDRALLDPTRHRAVPARRPGQAGRSRPSAGDSTGPACPTTSSPGGSRARARRRGRSWAPWGRPPSDCRWARA